MTPCPDDTICQRCPASVDDDVCLTHERQAAERDQLRTGYRATTPEGEFLEANGAPEDMVREADGAPTLEQERDEIVEAAPYGD